MLDPFNEKRSTQDVKERLQLIEIYDFGSVYPQETMEEIEEKVEAGEAVKPPRCIFCPSQELA
jgi:hypothetical protein